MAYPETRVLITGAAGFIGSNMSSHIMEQGGKVVGVDNLTRRGTRNNLEWLSKSYPGQFEFHQVDVSNFDAVAQIVERSQPEYVFHLSAQVAVTSSLLDPVADFRANAQATLALLEAIRRRGDSATTLFASTNKVYGNGVNALKLVERKNRYEFKDPKFRKGIPENFTTDSPEHSPYGCSKYTADLYMRDYARCYGLKTVCMRMSCIYGIRQFGNEDQGWVAHFAISTLLGKPITIYGDGKQVRDILYVNDLIGGYDLSVKNINKTKGEAFNVGGGPSNTCSLLELLGELRSLTGASPKVEFSDWRAGDQRVYVSNIGKLRRVLGWKPKTKWRQGLAMLVDWIRANRHLFE